MCSPSPKQLRTRGSRPDPRDGASLLGYTYTEPTGVDLISSRLQPDVIAQAKPVLDTAARRAREARQLADAGDHNEATRIWHSLCGDCFPAPEEQDVAAALGRSFQGGAVTTSGTVSTARSGAQTSRPVRPWKTL